MTRVLHIIERLTLGGACRALITAVAHSVTTRGTTHRILSLRNAHPGAASLAQAARLTLVTPGDVCQEIANADVVHIHFWNTPELYRLLRSPLPPCRVVVTSHVVGSTTPHILTDTVIEFADLVLLTSLKSFETSSAALRERAVLAPSAADFTRLVDTSPVVHDGFNVGYIGTVDFSKMRPSFVRLHADLVRAGARVIVCGDGGARKQLAIEAEALGIADRFDQRGRVEDIGSVLSTLDVFGYPLCDNSYATTELVLHEAQYAGVPCVALLDGGAADAIVDGVTGFVVTNEADYIKRVTRLRDDPVLRRRMSAAAAAHARQNFGAAHLAPLVDAAYDRAMQLPKRLRAGSPPLAGVAAFLESLGDAATPFSDSMSTDWAITLKAESVIAAASPALSSADAGGVLHYRRTYPEDPILRFWAGLVLLGQGRPALAAAEFRAAEKMGFNEGKAAYYLALAATAAGAAKLAETARARATAAGYQ